MRVTQWFAGLLARGQVPPPDPDAIVELGTFAFSDGPMIVAALRSDGVGATSVEAFDPVTGLARMRIMVRRSDLPAARATVERFRN
jgi:hypothetical protein